MSKKEKKSKQRKNLLKKELETYDRQGVRLLLNGEESTPKEIAKAHQIKEEGTYMRDYVQNMKGEVQSVEFNLIREVPCFNDEKA